MAAGCCLAAGWPKPALQRRPFSILPPASVSDFAGLFSCEVKPDAAIYTYIYHYMCIHIVVSSLSVCSFTRFESFLCVALVDDLIGFHNQLMFPSQDFIDSGRMSLIPVRTVGGAG